MLRLAVVLALVSASVFAATVDLEQLGAKAEDSSEAVELSNGKLLTATLGKLRPGDRLLIPDKTFHVMGGIEVTNLTDVVIQLDGTLMFSSKTKVWPRTATGGVLPCMHFMILASVHFSDPWLAT